ncbi:murein biosynthesis integral membrane protein MurJ [Lutibacter sp. B2]|nr:murein biosynthesis integral membrane protein MurJ [Lutibacter sp. B2]
MSNYKSVAKTIFAVIIFTFFAKFLGFFRDILVGSKLGTDMVSDAYLMALNSTSIIFVSLGTALITGAIPIIVKQITNKDRQAAFDFTNKLLNIFILLSSIVTVVCILFAKPIMSILASGFKGEQLELTIQLVKIMFPILICISITYMFVSLLQALGRFKITSIISFPANSIAILYLCFLSQKYGVKGLAVVTLIGWMLQFIIQIPYLYGEGYRYHFKIDFKDENVKNVFKIILPMIIVAASVQLNILLDEKQASFLKQGTISSLHYANMMYQAITSTTVLAIGMVMFPKFAEKSAKLGQKEYAKFVLRIVEIMIFILLPMMTGIILLRNEIIGLIFQRGAFGENATLTTGIALACYSTGMVGFGIQDLINRAFYARNNIKFPVIYAILVVGINAILNIVLVKRFDIAGLAISTACASLIGAFGLLHSFKKKMNYLDVSKLLRTFTKVGISCTVMAMVVLFSQIVLKQYFFSMKIGYKLIAVLVPSFIGGSIYAFVTLKFKIDGAMLIYNDFIKPRFMNK